MKIAWFTYFDQASAIGNCGRLICEELVRRGHTVDVFSPYVNRCYETQLNVIYYSAEAFDVNRLDLYDHVIYNMGNHIKFHYDIWCVLKRYPGKVIQHDRIMVDFFKALYFDPKYAEPGVDGYVGFSRIMQDVYGREGKTAADFFTCRDADSTKVLELEMRYSLVPAILRYATGVFTHSESFREELADCFWGPMGSAYLPCIEKECDPADLPEPFVQKDDKVLVVSTGDVQRLKRLHVVTEVLKENPGLAGKIRYAVIGRWNSKYGERLKSQSESELRDCLYLLGYQPENIMVEFLKQANIAINLRYPNSEVGSLSLLEQMMYTNATVVLNTGFFAEVPADTVKRIPLANEKEELKKVLQELIGNPSERKKIAENAHNFVIKNCNVENYVNEFLCFLNCCVDQEAYCSVVRSYLGTGNLRLRELGYTEELLEEGIYDIIKKYESILGRNDDYGDRRNTIGFWIGEKDCIPDWERRIRFLVVLADMLSLEFHDIEIEVWCDKKDRKAVSDAFGSCAQTKVITIENWADQLSVTDQNRKRVLAEWKDSYLLYKYAFHYSQASYFVTADIGMDQIFRTGKSCVAFLLPGDIDRIIPRLQDDEKKRAAAEKCHARLERLLRQGIKLVVPIGEKEIVRHWVNNIRDDDIWEFSEDEGMPKGCVSFLEE